MTEEELKQINFSQANQYLLIEVRANMKAMEKNLIQIHEDIKETKTLVKENTEHFNERIERLDREKQDKKEAKELYDTLVTKTEYYPIKKFVYGTVGFVLLTFLSAIAYVIIPNIKK